MGHSYYNIDYTTPGISSSRSDFGGSSGLEGCYARTALSGYNYTNWKQLCAEPLAELLKDYGKSYNRRTTYRIEIDKNPTDTAGIFGPPSSFNPIAPGEANATDDGAIEFVEIHTIDTDGQLTSPNPPIFETEPKQDIDLDIYYEVDSTFPLEINDETNYTFAPIGTTISVEFNTSVTVAVVESWDGNIVTLGDSQGGTILGQGINKLSQDSIDALMIAKWGELRVSP